MGTLVAYLNAFLSFSDWCVSSGWATRVPDVPALECALIEWMEERHEAGVGPYIGNCAFGAIRVLSRRIHGELEDARGLLADWNGLGHAKHWPPLPYPLLPSADPLPNTLPLANDEPLPYPLPYAELSPPGGPLN